jgi:hypothetical protein
MEHQSTKHIEIHKHFIKQLMHDGILSLEYFPTEEKVPDLLTKPLSSPHFLQLRLMLEVKEVVFRGSS